MAFEQDLNYTFAGTTQVGKFSAVKPGTGATYKDDFILPAAKNDPVLGVVQDGVYPHGGADYAKGRYFKDLNNNYISGAAWPSNVQPTAPAGQKRTVRRFGRQACIAAGACARGNRAIIANAYGEIEDVDQDAAITASTPINVLGVFETAATNEGDVVYVMVNPHKETK